LAVPGDFKGKPVPALDEGERAFPCPDSTPSSRFFIVLVRPEHPENVGLVARCMKNTGFSSLRLVGVEELDHRAYRTAVHAGEILESAGIFESLEQAVEDLEMVFAATSKPRKQFTLISLDDAVARMFDYPLTTRTGLVFGNERTGLTSEELRHANVRFTIPQAARQPSYNIASAVLLTLFSLFIRHREEAPIQEETPLPWKEQEDTVRRVLEKLERQGFIHRTNKRRITEALYDLFGRLGMTEKDRKLLLALFSKRR